MKMQPTQFHERIVSIDVLRGFAVLGILIMNIQSFAMISAAYLNPTAYGNLTGANRWVWILSHVFADTKFWTIFSLLFGAGIVLFTERLKAKGINSIALHYRRILWLLIFGLMHAYLLWSGDILVAYSVCGLLTVLFRNLKPKSLLWIGIAFFSVSSLLYLLSGFSMPFWPEESLYGLKETWLPSEETIRHQLEALRGSWISQMEVRVPDSLSMQTYIFFYNTGWRTFGLMLIGMGLYKLGILSARKSTGFYIRMALIALLVGFPLVLLGVVNNFNHEFSLDYSFFLGSQFNYWGSLGVSLGYVAIMMLVVKACKNGWIVKSLKAVGQMAFTNYLMQTIICTFIFYGHGLGFFGKIERTGQILIVLPVWTFQMIVSPVWLKYFKYGPFEWLWRSLTYWKLQPMKK